MNPENTAGMVLLDAAPVNKKIVFQNILKGKQKEFFIKIYPRPLLLIKIS